MFGNSSLAVITPSLLSFERALRLSWLPQSKSHVKVCFNYT